VVDHGETVVCPGMKKFGGIGGLAVDANEDIESRRTGWRDCGIRVWTL
jgi:hypothetical protein